MLCRNLKRLDLLAYIPYQNAWFNPELDCDSISPGSGEQQVMAPVTGLLPATIQKNWTKSPAPNSATCGHLGSEPMVENRDNIFFSNLTCYYKMCRFLIQSYLSMSYYLTMLPHFSCFTKWIQLLLILRFSSCSRCFQMSPSVVKHLPPKCNLLDLLLADKQFWKAI